MTSADHSADTRERRRSPWKNRLKHGVTACFFVLVPVLLFMLLRDTDWQEVKEALQGYRIRTLLGGAAIAGLSFLVFSSYDLLGRIYTGHRLPVRQILPLAFVCYAFNLNFGAWVGGVALRYRLYSRLGLKAPTITGVLSISLITNWLGYMLVAGTLFSFRLMAVPSGWKINVVTLQFIGFGLLAVSFTYLLACRLAKRRSWQWRKHQITLPSLKLASMQAFLGALKWLLMAALIYLLLPEQAFYPSVLAILMVSSIAGVITHIPAGLGVLEAVFIALLKADIATGALMAALIAYRAVYFLLPLSFALVIYLVMEKRAKKTGGDSRGAADAL